MAQQHPKIFCTSDLHFRHKAEVARRGFADIDEHDEHIVAQWNAAVRPIDTVIVQGDITVGRIALAWPYVDRLNGTLHLIAGNHDAVFGGSRDAQQHQPEWLEHFASVQAFARRRLEGQDILFSHFPYEGDSENAAQRPDGKDRYQEYRLRDEGLTVVHGHIHSEQRVSRSSKGTLQIHIGVNAWDYTPVELGVIQKIIRDEAAREQAFTEMVQLGEEIGGPDAVVCVTHARFAPCRIDIGCILSDKPESVEAVRIYQAGM